jgi:hypothetical protein
MPKQNSAFENGVEITMKGAKIVKSSGLKESKKGKKYLSFKAVTNADLKNPDKGEVSFSATAFGKAAEEIAANERGTFTLKGSIQVEEWDKDGEIIPVKKLLINIADPERGRPSTSSGRAPQRTSSRTSPVDDYDDVDDEIPF